jgi:hypothetical protein
MGKTGRMVLSIVVILVLYGVVNLVLVGGQTLLHKDDNERMEVLKGDMTEMEGLKEVTEAWLNDREYELNELMTESEELGAYIDQMEIEFPDGIPEDLYGEYIDAIDEYNVVVEEMASLNAEFEDEQGLYEEQLDAYNAAVEEYNELAEEAGSMWVLIPGFKK